MTDSNRPTDDGDDHGVDGDPSDGTFTAVVDRFEDDLAVLVLERDGETAGQHVTAAANLPDDGRKVDAVLTITLDDGELIAVEHQPEETDERKESMQDRFSRLSRRPSDEDENDST